MNLVNGLEFRRLVRKHEFGEASEGMYLPTRHPQPIQDISPYVDLVSKLTPPPLFVEVEESEEYFVLQVWLLKETGGDEFGQEEVEVERTRSFVHSFVCKKTGEVYLPNDDESGPATSFGPRCNANEIDTCQRFGLDLASGKLKPFVLTARALLERGVDVDEGNVWGETALLQASLFLDLPTVSWLIGQGASPNKQTTGSKSHALFRALEGVGSLDVRLKVLRVLVEEGGADCNLANRHGFTPLHLAHKLKLDQAVVDFLLAQGKANPLAVDCAGKRPDEY
ncbi:hypothetical protein BASA81_001737 [Batrachochytrium salamandrivorans]|nr:hypothetical protein BASA81_001737 [Batrachochytrium salamandrivorans]